MSWFLVKFGSFVAAGGVGWAVYKATDHLVLGDNGLINAANAIMSQRGPLEICAAGIGLWLLGKWRAHVVVR
jgi:hypothetical protein